MIFIKIVSQLDYASMGSEGLNVVSSPTSPVALLRPNSAPSELYPAIEPFPGAGKLATCGGFRGGRGPGPGAGIVTTGTLGMGPVGGNGEKTFDGTGGTLPIGWLGYC